MNKKLLIIVPSLCLGGQERVAVNTLDIMQKDFDVTLLIFDNKTPAYTPLGKVININIPATSSYFLKIINVLRRVLKVRKIKKALSIDYSISFGSTANIVNVLSKSKDKTLISIRGYSSIGTSVLDKYLYKKCDRVVACSEEMAMKIKKISASASKKTAYLYNSYNFETLLDMSKEDVDDFDFSLPTIVSHGRLEKIKNHKRLINAFAIAKIRVSKLQLLIIGEGSERKNLELEIKKLKLETCIKLIGFRKNPFKYIAKSSIFVLTSNSEGFPNALVEGMCFLPVISVDCKTGPREILGNSISGILIKNNEDSADLIAESIVKLIKNPSIYDRYKNAARNRALDFSCESYRKNLVDILG